MEGCSICGRKVYDLFYLQYTITDCHCGNKIKSEFLPCIYIGIAGKQHVCIIPFPGCTVCGRPMNMPWVIHLNCESIEERKSTFQEVYHNYGQRN